MAAHKKGFSSCDTLGYWGGPTLLWRQNGGHQIGGPSPKTWGKSSLQKGGKFSAPKFFPEEVSPRRKNFTFRQKDFGPGFFPNTQGYPGPNFSQITPRDPGSGISFQKLPKGNPGSKIPSKFTQRESGSGISFQNSPKGSIQDHGFLCWVFSSCSKRGFCILLRGMGWNF